jgi:hypothetical protein
VANCALVYKVSNEMLNSIEVTEFPPFQQRSRKEIRLASISLLK